MGRSTKYTEEFIRNTVATQGLENRAALRSFNPSMYQAANKMGGLLDDLFGVTQKGGVRKPKAEAEPKVTKPAKAEAKPKVARGTKPKVTRRSKVMANGGKVTITNSSIDEVNVSFDFDVSLKQLTAAQAEKFLTVINEFKGA